MAVEAFRLQTNAVDAVEGMAVGRAASYCLTYGTNATETFADFRLVLWGFNKRPYSHRKQNLFLSFQMNLKAR